MKKIFLIALSFISLLSFAQTNYTINGKIGSLSAPAKVYLVYRSAGNTITDSAALKNGSFQFKGTVVNPFKVNLILDHKGSGIKGVDNPDALNIYIEQGTIDITSTDSISKAVVNGSVVNAEFLKLKALLKSTVSKQHAFFAEYEKVSEETQKSKEFQADFEKRYDAIEAEIKQLNLTFIQQNRESFVSLDALKTVAGAIPDVNEIEPLFNTLSEKVRNSQPGKDYAKLLASLKLVAIGAVAPDFTLNDSLGNSIKLSDFKGKYVLLDFWASWCGPCRRDNPNVVKTFNLYKDKNFTILGVSLDRSKAAWLKAIKDDSLTWSHVSDLKFWNSAAAELYGVKAIPQNFLINPEGKIIAHNLHGDELNDKLAQLIK